MRTVSRRSLFFISSSSFPSPRFLQISHFSTSHGFQSHEYRNVRVSVWWDFENCQLPTGTNTFKVAHNITSAIRGCGIKGPVQITAFGDMQQLSRCNQEALSSTGITLNHIPCGGKNSADRSLLVDLMYWVSQNPPPAHLFLISGDRDFATILHRLRMNNYNILLAGREKAPGVLCSAASIMWHWDALIKEENLTGKYFNQPPDGPYGSWYGHYKVPLENPFSVAEKQTSSRMEELPEPDSDSSIRQIPKPVTELICHLLRVHSKGISITDLRAKLLKSSLSIDKDYYGYKKFSSFLSAMPHILSLQYIGHGQFLVHATSEKSPESGEDNSDSSVPTTGSRNGNISASKVKEKSISGVADKNNEHKDLDKILKFNEKSVTGVVDKNKEGKDLDEILMLNGSEKHVSNDVDGKKSLPTSFELNEETSRNMEDSPLGEKGNGQSLAAKLDSESEMGFFRKIWRKWFGGTEKSSDEECYTSGASSEKKGDEAHANCGTSDESSKKTKVVENCLKSASEDVESVRPVPFSLDEVKLTANNDYAPSSEESGDRSSKNTGIYNHIVRWFGFLRSGSDSDQLSDQSTEILGQVNSISKRDELLSNDSFWTELDSFMDTPKGSKLITQSRTREQIAKHLQKKGPAVLQSLSETDLLHLVNLLIVEKKWVQECSSEMRPFKLTRSVKEGSDLGNPRVSRDLRSIFTGKPSISRLPKQPEDGEKNNQYITHAEVSQHANKKPLEKSRNEILADCQKLVNEVLKKFPQGYNVSVFRKHFNDTYGYPLDVEKLGYERLTSLLQIVPGVKIESYRILPSHKASKSIARVNAASLCKSDNYDSDSQWEELGPVSNRTPSGTTPESSLRRRSVQSEYESPSYDEFTDSEEETRSRPEASSKPTMNGEDDSSLLQVLNAWYSKEEENKKDKPENTDGMLDFSTLGLEKTDSSQARGKNASPLKVKPRKSYSFVSDTNEIREDKIIDGIIGKLKTAEKSSMVG